MWLHLLQATSVHTILASNTSSISITKLGSATSRPHRVVSGGEQGSSHWEPPTGWLLLPCSADSGSVRTAQQFLAAGHGHVDSSARSMVLLHCCQHGRALRSAEIAKHLNSRTYPAGATLHRSSALCPARVVCLHVQDLNDGLPAAVECCLFPV
jgi:hypothetical protein